MNPKPISETDAIRSDIEMTRRRMDDTVDALGERMHGRHLLDEVIGFFRGSDDGSGTGARVREKISDSAGTAANAVVDTVKTNPLPILLITAGAAWLAYSATRSRTADVEEDVEDDDSDRYNPDTHYDRPLEYPGTGTSAVGQTMDEDASEGESKFTQMKDTVQEKASAAKEQVKQKLSELGDKTRDTFNSVRDRASDISNQVPDRTRELYGQTRDRVARTANEHPLEVGLGCLAVGVLIGLALPTPEPVNRIAGPTVDRLRNRTKDTGREMLQKGKRVVQAATDAAKQEAQSQGLTPDRLRKSGASVAEHAEAAATDAAQEEGMMGDDNSTRSNTGATDPSAARPAV